jgi:hypothetical protein
LYLVNIAGCCKKIAAAGFIFGPKTFFDFKLKGVIVKGAKSIMFFKFPALFNL